MSGPTVRRRAPAAKVLVGTLALGLILSACSSKSAGTKEAVDTSGVKTGAGVTSTTITLGSLTDHSGPLKEAGLQNSAGNALWVKDINAKGGVCGRQIKIVESDHSYKADVATTEYAQMRTQVAGLVQLFGSPVTAALKPSLVEDHLVATASTFSSAVLDTKNVVIIGSSYDVEMINGLSYLLSSGKIAEGDSVGHIYIEGELGSNGLLGSQYFAKQHHLKIVPVAVASTDTNMTNIVTGFKSAGVKAILLSATPGATASAIGAANALGLDVPFLGNNPSFNPAILNGPAGSLITKMFVVSSTNPFSATTPVATHIATALKADFPNVQPSQSVDFGYAVGLTWQRVLELACQAKDLTPAGLLAALGKTTKVDTSGLTGILDYSVQGAPPTRETFIAHPDPSVAGGLTIAQPLLASPDAKKYVAPHQVGG
jgi:ABC-type branched-subunit amino acid transport system substrate-binding protein